MEIKILKEEKGIVELEIDNLTIVELLRAYLNKEDIKLAAWKREHPTKNPVLRVEADNAKKIVLKVIEKIQGELDDLASEYKKTK
jgi:DNA-directed RNA polymerase subunit L